MQFVWLAASRTSGLNLVPRVFSTAKTRGSQRLTSLVAYQFERHDNHEWLKPVTNYLETKEQRSSMFTALFQFWSFKLWQ